MRFLYLKQNTLWHIFKCVPEGGEGVAINMEEKIVFCKGGGCTAKLGAGVLSRVLEKLPRGEQDPSLLVGYDSRDDAAVYKISDDTAIVQTLDFFPPMVDDPYTFGQIAAANALSDIYAMGAQPRLALNIMAVSPQMPDEAVREVLRGGYTKAAEAGVIISGGHTIRDPEPKYGLSVTGFAHPDKIRLNCTPRAGDVLILTKALGTGILASGIGMRDVEVVRDSHGKPAIALHGAAACIAEEQGVVDVSLSITYTHSVAVANAVAITKASQAEREKRRDVKAELAQQFKEMRGMLDDLGEQTATSAEAKGAGEPVSE